MNLKKACEATGLSSGAVRYYVNEGLVVPETTENYIGLKIHSFSLENIEELKAVAADIPYDKSLEEPDVWRIILSVLKAALRIAIVWAPILICLFAFIYNLTIFRFPIFVPFILLSVLLLLLPSLTVLAISRIRFKWKKPILVILLVLCILSTPYSTIVSAFGISESRTDNVKNYLKTDDVYSLCQNEIFKELFPAEPPVDKTDMKYFYRYFNFLDSSCDVYAEWTLSGNEYIPETNRVKELFERSGKSNTHGYKLTAMKKGGYNCLILYDNAEPFEKASGFFSFLIFAYNDTNKSVRYIYSDSYGGGEQPYYLQLDW